MPTSVETANEQQGALYWRLDQQCASPMQETALPVIAYPSFSLWIICIYAVMLSRLQATQTLSDSAVQAHPKPNSFWGIWVVYRSSLGSAVVSTKGHAYCISDYLQINTSFLFLTLVLWGETIHGVSRRRCHGDASAF